MERGLDLGDGGHYSPRGCDASPNPSGPALELDDLEDVALLLFATRRSHQRSNGGGMSTALADDFAEVLLGDTELEHVCVLADHLFDLDLIRSIHESLNDRHDERLHCPLHTRVTG